MTATDGARITNTQYAIPNQVKLVIWDLDDTLWHGTLSEGPVALPPARARLVRELNRRGIVNSISSKNDASLARLRLETEGLWDQFVFPRINWLPKGQQIATMIGDMQLRAANVLFVDDNVLNLQEAQHYAPGLMTALPSALDALLEHPKVKGKDDTALTRLHQYRVLEQKLQDRAVASASNEEFLAACDIRVTIGHDCAAHAERLVDLLNRTNQLNFTKRRFTLDDFDLLLADRSRSTGYVVVADRYGDYGICGFYSLRNGQLDDFVFSCRTMNMGVEQWLYTHLGCPRLTIAGDVASDPDSGDVTWITLDDFQRDRPAVSLGGIGPAARKDRILLKGGCDLQVIADLLAGDVVDTELSYTNVSGEYVHRHHTEMLKRCVPATIARYGDIIDAIPFLDRQGYESQLTLPESEFGTVIYSLILDYTQNLYRLRERDFVVPFEQLHIDVTDPSVWPRVIKQWGANGVNSEFLSWFAQRFEAVGPLSVDMFKANVEELASSRPTTRFIFLNAPEVALENDLEPDRHLHHRRLNVALDDIVAGLPNAVICDLRSIVTSPDDLTTNIRHYKRQTYVRIAEALAALVQSEVEVVTPGLVEVARRALNDRKRAARRALGSRKRALVNLLTRP